MATDLDRLESLVQDFGGDRALVRGVVATYLAELDGRIRDIVDAVASGDRDRVAASAHSLKSASAMLGIESVRAPCAELEARARNGMLGPTAGFLTLVAEAADAVRPVLERW